MSRRITSFTGSLVIEHGIPLPEGVVTRSKWIDTFRKMKVGDSFLLPANGSSAKNQGAIPTSMAYRARVMKQLPETFKVTVRKVRGGHRVWRIA